MSLRSLLELCHVILAFLLSGSDLTNRISSLTRSVKALLSSNRSTPKDTPDLEEKDDSGKERKPKRAKHDPKVKSDSKVNKGNFLPTGRSACCTDTCTRPSLSQGATGSATCCHLCASSHGVKHTDSCVQLSAASIRRIDQGKCFSCEGMAHHAVGTKVSNSILFCCPKCAWSDGAEHKKGCGYTVKFPTAKFFISTYKDYFANGGPTEDTKHAWLTNNFRKLQGFPSNADIINREVIEDVLNITDEPEAARVQEFLQTHYTDKDNKVLAKPLLEHKNARLIGRSPCKDSDLPGCPKWVALAILAFRVSGVSGSHTIQVVRSDSLHPLDAPSFKMSVGQWDLKPDYARSMNAFPVVDNPFVYQEPSSMRIVLPCDSDATTFEYFGDVYNVLDMCHVEVVSHEITFSSSFVCSLSCDSFAKCCEEIRNDAECVSATDLQLYTLLKQRFQSIKTLSALTITYDSVVSSFTSRLPVILAPAEPMFSTQLSVGLVKVDGKLAGTWFCTSPGIIYSAWHVLTPAEAWFSSKDPVVEICKGRTCIKPETKKKIGKDVAQLKVADSFAMPLVRSGLEAIGYANTGIRIFNPLLDHSADSTTVSLPSGGWAKGMSGGPLVVDGRPVGVITSKRGFFLFGTELRVYGLDGEPYVTTSHQGL